ncbi:hypothetical protein DT73_20770 [Mangrovibacter sp. MFB070]|uniref:hypothetical protein n=1 Tax=Mangrovibacter sp. MFB070 TaxID=1224318 RepID=UPI0004D3D9E1|nr:hypothetical protein [Mangrovibacter sp. MFB070]KEA50875.1 hypothetical protein DT73_20770 [Mangrovibacter sp. MFB070]
MIKILIACSALVLCSSLCYADSTVQYSGNKFTALITRHCAEGNVSCDNVSIESKSKATGRSITLKGKKININCPETCDFRGYEFKNGAYTYSLVTDDFETWVYSVYHGSKLISEDKGVIN